MLSWPQQLAHLFLFIGAVFCAIFLRGDARLMFGVMAAAPVALLLSLIPQRFFPSLLRQLLQMLIGGAALYWAYTKLNTAPIDLILVEVGCILGVALFIGRNAHEYAMLYFISIGFLGYGGLMPGRAFFLHVFTVSAIILLSILYASRMAILQTAPQHDLAKVAPARRRRTLRFGHSFSYRLLHAVAALVVLLAMLRYLPQTRKLKIKGLIPVSFTTENEILFPDLWKNWHQPASKLVGGTAENNSKDQGKGGKSRAKQNSFDASNILNMPNQPTFDSRSGNGFAFGTGNQLVFRVISPAKLYWVVQMYDDYDGDTWKVSNAMYTGNTGPDHFIPVHEVEVPQHFSMDNPNSNKLPYAYRFRQVTLRNNDMSYAPGLIRANRSDAFSITLRTDKMIKPPWTYRVQSFVPNPEIKKPLRAWREPLRNNGWNYRRLPEALISDRLRELAADLTQNASTPYEKALNIRNFLRSNCTYTLSPPPVPPNREVADFFIFESKQGYCQHFAQAFTILARLAGLHARLVTGYAPGNYNLLTNTFEVYQYHAHAWTHIFIEPYGWLTFDGVAPGNLHLENTPALLTELMDPFGKEWNARPPELTYIPPPPPEQSMAKNEKNTDPANTFAGKVYAKAAKDNKTDEPNSTELGKAAIQIASATLSEKLSSLWKKFSSSVVQVLNGLVNATHLLTYSLKRMDWLDMLASAFILLTLALAVHARAWLLVRWNFLKQLYRCRRSWYSLQQSQLTPEDIVMTCNHVALSCLRLAGFTRPPACDNLEWADLIAQTAPELVNDYKPIAIAASRLQFSAQTLSPELAADIISATEKLCHNLSPYLTQTFAHAPRT